MFIQSEREIVEEGTQDRGEKKCYGIDLEIVEDGNRAFAKIENNKYFIKKATSGPESGHFLNPFSIWYQKVNSTCFNLYLRFLETRNLAHYRNAERALIP
jgi:hypothetical protein